MPTLQEILASGQGGAAGTEPASDTGPFQGLADFFSALGSGAFEAGKGAFFGLLDVLDRPGRAVRHAVTGDWRQALEAFDPGNLFTSTESRPISGGEVLERWGVEEGPQVGIPGTSLSLGSTRAIGGFGVSLLLDPLTYFGAPVGAFAQKGLAKAGTGLRAGLERTAALGGRTGRVVAPVAELALDLRRGFGRGFVKDFELLEAQRLGEIVPDSVANLLKTRAEADAFLQAGEQQLAARGKAIDAAVAREQQDVLTKFMEIPGATEELLTKRMGVPAGQLRHLADAEKVTELRRALGVSDEMVDAQIRNFSDDQIRAFDLHLRGERNALIALPGKRGLAGEAEDIVTGANRGIQEDYFAWDHLQVEAAEKSLATLGVSHVGHFSTKHGVRDMERVLAQELGAAAPALKGLEGEAMLAKAASAIDAVTDPLAKLRARKILGTIEQINATAAKRGLPPLFRTSLTEVTIGEGLRYLHVRNANQMTETLLGDPNLARVFKTPPGAEMPAGFVSVPIEELPTAARQRLVAAGTPFVAMPRAVAKEIMGRGGFLARMDRLAKDPNPVLEGLQAFNRIYKPWTLNLPATAVRNLVGDLALNASAGVSPWAYKPALPVFQAFMQLRDGKAVTRTIQAHGKTVDAATYVRTMVAAGVPGQGVWSSEVARRGIDALASGNWRTVLGWESWKRGVPGIRHASELIQEHGTAVARIAHYMERTLGRGMSPIDAAASVKKHLYDFANLTPLEQRVMAQVFPFYSWARQNIPNQLKPETLLGGFGFGQPGRIGARFVPSVAIAREKVTLDRENRVDIPEAMLPTWLQGQLTLPVGRKDGVLSLFAFNQWLPVADLTEIDNPRKLFKYVFNSLTPLAGEPIEQLVNMDAYFERAIQAYAGEQEQLLGHSVGRRSAKVLRNARIINELDRSILPLLGIKTGSERLKDGLAQPEWWALLARATAGVKVREVDLQDAKRRSLARIERETRDLEMRRRFAQRDREPSNVTVLDNLLREKRALRETIRAMNPADVPALWMLTEPALAESLRDAS